MLLLIIKPDKDVINISAAENIKITSQYIINKTLKYR